MLSRSILLLTLAIAVSSVQFEDNEANSGARNGPFDSDSIVVESAGAPAGGDPDTRFFGLGGGSGILGGLMGGGYRPPIGGGFGYPGGAFGGSFKPGRCPGLLGLGIGQPQNYGGYGYGGYPTPYGGGFGHGLGFRSGDQSGNEAAGEIPSRRRRDENSAVEAAPEGRALPDGSADGANHDARFFGGMFGKNCFYDYHCPGQLKCCASGLLGNRATCQQPAIFG